MVTLEPTVAICVNVDPLSDRLTLNPLSFRELSFHVRLTPLDETAFALALLGATGTVTDRGVWAKPDEANGQIATGKTSRNVLTGPAIAILRRSAYALQLRGCE
jgi:hypothetical protein